MIDTHVHYDHRRFDSDRDVLLEAVHRDTGVELAVNLPISFRSNVTMRETLRDYPWIRFGLGVHPNHLEDWEEAHLTALADLRDGRTVAVGETGLDYCRIRDPESRGRQALAFRQQIDLARQLRLPLILHVRDAWDAALAELRAQGRAFDGVLHCFAADEATGRAYVELGFRLGIGGAVTDLRKAETRQAVAALPLEAMVLETDCPFLHPDGKGRNSSRTLPRIASELAALKGIAPEAVIAATTQTARELFHL